MPTIDYLVNKKKVPSTTQVLNRFKNATGLIIWANNLGKAGLDYFEELNKAGTIGTKTHELGQYHIENKPYDLPTDPQVLNCFNQFLEWWDNSDYKVTWTEKPYASKKLLFGGCPDILVNGNILIDLKTSGKIYNDYIIQLSAYTFLIKEVDNIEIEEAIIVRFPKDDDQTEIMKFNKDDLAKGLKQFKTLRKAFDLDKDLNKILTKKRKEKRNELK